MIKATLMGLTLFCLAPFFSGCGLAGGREAGEDAISQFHLAFNREDFEAIREGAHQDFQKATTGDEYWEFMDAVRSKLGQVVSTSNQSLHINRHNMITNIVMVQKTVFEEGEATETFTFRKNGEQAVLLNYHIESLALITR